jgi:hypothetical protein
MSGAMSHRPTGQAPSRLLAVLGPTNTGKTHLAVERMLGHASGMIGLPLRLLAREIYDRIVKARGPRAVALITGEEKIVPPRAHYFVCTVEAMPMNRQVEFLAIDEAQLVADPARGHIFTTVSCADGGPSRPCSWAPGRWRRCCAVWSRPPRSSSASGSPPSPMTAPAS